MGAAGSVDWIPEVWDTWLDGRARDMLSRRSRDETLEGIGRHHDVSRERARQIIRDATRTLITAADHRQPSWRHQVLEALEGVVAAPDSELDVVLADPLGPARHALLWEAGARHPRTWAGALHGFWTLRPESLDLLFKELARSGPYRSEELISRAEGIGIPSVVPVESIAGHHSSRLTMTDDGSWIRRSARGRDPAYLWLAERGEPRRIEAIADGVGGKARALAESLRRDDRFRQIRPEGTWALTEWPSAGARDYTNAVDVVLDVLTEFGPMTRSALFSEVTRRYPVSHARLQQCLISDAIGTTPDGLLDLVERGAEPLEEDEPRRPENVAVDDSGKVMGVRLRVGGELLRGSSAIVHPWITWYLGLRRAPMSRVFEFDDGSGTLTVRRSTSAAQLSSLRSRSLDMGLVPGCGIVVILRLDSGTASMRHVCGVGDCPGR
jgi:hypothetical protein